MRIYTVGGAVRDRLLGREVTEVDHVVVGATAEALQAQGFRPVGADFPVFLHPRTGEEYALARTERKSGRGYGGFTFHASPDVTLEEDLLRRDLTINAMAEGDDGQIIDPYGGQRDLAERWLRHVSPAFAEDPLRVLRVARFAARYADLGFRVAPDTQTLMQRLAASGELRDLTPERAWKEISRALMEPRPDVFIQVLRDCGALAELFAEIDALFDVDHGAPAQALLASLRRGAEHAQPLPVRWAALLAPLADSIDNCPDEANLEAIEAVNRRCKPPRECQELALLSGRYRREAERAEQLSAERLLALLQHFDIYRRPQRFEHFLAVCDMVAAPSAIEAASEVLRGAAEAARAVAVQPLLDAGHRGPALGEALRAARLEALSRYLQTGAPPAGP